MEPSFGQSQPQRRLPPFEPDLGLAARPRLLSLVPAPRRLPLAGPDAPPEPLAVSPGALVVAQGVERQQRTSAAPATHAASASPEWRSCRGGCCCGRRGGDGSDCSEWREGGGGGGKVAERESVGGGLRVAGLERR